MWASDLTLGTLLLPACSVNVKKEQNGEDKQVDIDTPVGGIHVSKGANVADVGLRSDPGHAASASLQRERKKRAEWRRQTGRYRHARRRHSREQRRQRGGCGPPI